MLLDPARPGDQFVVAATRTDELDRERQAEWPGVEGQGDAGCAEQGPRPVEDRIAGIAQSSRRFAARGRGEQQVEIFPGGAQFLQTAIGALVGVGHIGKTLSQMHRPADAEPYLQRAAQLEPFTAVTHYRLSLVYRAAGRTAEAQKELAEFQRLKDMKERLKQVYQEMRLQPVKQERPDTDTAK